MERGRDRHKAGPQHRSSPFQNPQQLPENKDNKLYVGNLSPNVSEFNIITLFKPFGKIVKEEFLWHKSGPKKGQPRGFCFVEFATRQEAELAMAKLNGKPLMGRPLVIRFAHEKSQDDTTVKSQGTTTTTTTTSTKSNEETQIGLEAKIKAIEMKLKLMADEDASTNNEEKERNSNKDFRAKPY